MRRTLLSTVLCLVLVPAWSTAAHAAPTTSTPTSGSSLRGAIADVRIQNWGSQRCVDLDGQGPGGEGRPVQQWYCLANQDNQDFTFVERGPGRWWIQNDKDHYCLDLPGTGAVAANTKVQEYRCADGDNQYWNGHFQFSYDAITDAESKAACPPARAGVDCFDYYQLHNVYWDGSRYQESSLCLEVEGVRNTNNGAKLQVYYCASGDDHEWTWSDRIG